MTVLNECNIANRILALSKFEALQYEESLYIVGTALVSTSEGTHDGTYTHTYMCMLSLFTMALILHPAETPISQVGSSRVHPNSVDSCKTAHNHMPHLFQQILTQVNTTQPTRIQNTCTQIHVVLTKPPVLQSCH